MKTQSASVRMTKFPTKAISDQLGRASCCLFTSKSTHAHSSCSLRSCELSTLFDLRRSILGPSES